MCPCSFVTISCWHMLRCGHLIFLVCQFAVFSRKNNILIFYAFLFFPLSFSQKKRERLDGENIYIRHSNLMLEVCMNLKLISVGCLYLLHSLQSPLSLCCVWFCMPLHERILGLKCFCMLVNMKICNHLSFWLFSFHLSYLSKKYMIGTTSASCGSIVLLTCRKFNITVKNSLNFPRI